MNSKKITIADIAARAGVSAMTVSRVLSGNAPVARNTEKRIRKIIAELGYQPNWLARSLSRKKSLILGVTVPQQEQVLMDNYIAQVLSGITDVAQQADYRILIIPFDPIQGAEDEYVQWARSKLIDGLILLKTIMGDTRIEQLAATEFPFVLINHKYRNDRVNFVDTRNVSGARKAVHYLFAKGYRKIAFVAGNLKESNAFDRLRGFKEAMHKLNLEIRKEWIIPGWFDQQAAYIESQRLFRNSDIPDAVFCSDDYMAIGVIRRAQETGIIVPRDLAVMGFDDIELAQYVYPSLTTVHQPLTRLGRKATQILLQLIDGSRIPPIHEFMQVDLIERESA